MCAPRHLLGQPQTKITHYCKTTKELAFSESPPSKIGKCITINLGYITLLLKVYFVFYHSSLGSNPYCTPRREVVSLPGASLFTPRCRNRDPNPNPYS
jgi:hypothetical protein